MVNAVGVRVVLVDVELWTRRSLGDRVYFVSWVARVLACRAEAERRFLSMCWKGVLDW